MPPGEAFPREPLEPIMSTKPPAEPVPIPQPDVIRPPGPAELPEPDLPTGIPQPGPDVGIPPPEQQPTSPPVPDEAAADLLAARQPPRDGIVDLHRQPRERPRRLGGRRFAVRIGLEIALPPRGRRRVRPGGGGGHRARRIREARACRPDAAGRARCGEAAPGPTQIAEPVTLLACSSRAAAFTVSPCAV